MVRRWWYLRRPRITASLSPDGTARRTRDQPGGMDPGRGKHISSNPHIWVHGLQFCCRILFCRAVHSCMHLRLLRSRLANHPHDDQEWNRHAQEAFFLICRSRFSGAMRSTCYTIGSRPRHDCKGPSTPSCFPTRAICRHGTTNATPAPDISRFEAASNPRSHLRYFDRRACDQIIKTLTGQGLALRGRVSPEAKNKRPAPSDDG